MDNLNKDLTGSSYIDISAMTENFITTLKQLGWLIVVLAFAGGGMFYIKSKGSYVPVYTAKGTFAVSVSGGESSTSGYYNNSAAKQMTQTYKYLLTSSIVRNIISKDLGTGAVPGSITADVVPETNLMMIKATASDPEKAYAIVKSVLDNYTEISNIVMYNAQMTLIEEPVVPKQPMNPPAYMVNAQKGVIAGGVAGLVVVIAYAAVRRTIFKSEDIKTELNLPCIGIIPEVITKKRSKKKKERILIIDEKSGFGFRESVRALRTKVEVSMKDQKNKVILVTSTLPNEGKTCMAVNLALALSQNNRAVALIDGDLRNPSVIKELGERNIRKGVSDVLNGKVKLSEAAIHVKDTNLTVLAGTERVDEAPEKLGSGSIEMIIEELLLRNEYIIIDTPPAGLMADAAVLAKYSNGIIIVVKQNYAKVSNIIEAAENLSHSHAVIIGCVLNKVKSNTEDLGYGGYGNYYKYGSYGSYGLEKEK